MFLIHENRIISEFLAQRVEIFFSLLTILRNTEVQIHFHQPKVNTRPEQYLVKIYREHTNLFTDQIHRCGKQKYQTQTHHNACSHFGFFFSYLQKIFCLIRITQTLLSFIYLYKEIHNDAS